MDKLTLSDFIDTKYHEFSKHYYGMLKEKIAAFTKIKPEELSVDNTIAPDQFVYGDRVILILVSGKEIRATLKLHYSPSEVQNVVPKKLVESTGNMDIAIESYFAEMTNLIAGNLKASFLDMNYTVGISLPIGASCYDELVSSDKLVPHRSYAYSAMQFADQCRFVLTLAIDLDDEGSGLKDFKYEVKSGSEEESDFL